MKQPFTYACILGLLAGTGGCNSDVAPSSAEGAADMHLDHDADAAVASAAAGGDLTPCDTEPLVPGMVAEGENLTVTLLDLSPAPPRKFDANTWEVEIRDSAGNPVTDLTGWYIEPWMVSHGHGAQLPAEITALDTPGQYTIASINLWMDGVWDVRFRVPDASERAAAIFYACIGGE